MVVLKICLREFPRVIRPSRIPKGKFFQTTTADFPLFIPELSIDATKSQFKAARVGARSHDVSPDIHYSVCSDLYSPNLRAATCRRMCSQTRYMKENLSSSLGLYSNLKNSGKSSVVVLKNLPTGGPLDTKTYPRVNLSILGTTLG